MKLFPFMYIYSVFYHRQVIYRSSLPFVSTLGSLSVIFGCVRVAHIFSFLFSVFLGVLFFFFLLSYVLTHDVLLGSVLLICLVLYVVFLLLFVFVLCRMPIVNSVSGLSNRDCPCGLLSVNLGQLIVA